MDPSTLGFVHKYWPSPEPEAARTLLLLHGTGGNETDLYELGKLLAPTANLLGVRGKVLEHGAPRYFRRLAEGIFDLDDLKRRTAELIKFIELAPEVYEFDSKKITAVGYSNGANIASSVLLSKPGVLKSAILLRGMVPFEPPAPPDLHQTGVLIASGKQDPIAPPAEAEKLAQILRTANAVVTVDWSNAGHNLVKEDMVNSKAWLELNQ